MRGDVGILGRQPLLDLLRRVAAPGEARQRLVTRTGKPDRQVEVVRQFAPQRAHPVDDHHAGGPHGLSLVQPVPGPVIQLESCAPAGPHREDHLALSRCQSVSSIRGSLLTRSRCVRKKWSRCTTAQSMPPPKTSCDR